MFGSLKGHDLSFRAKQNYTCSVQNVCIWVWESCNRDLHDSSYRRGCRIDQVASESALKEQPYTRIRDSNSVRTRYNPFRARKLRCVGTPEQYPGASTEEQWACHGDTKLDAVSPTGLAGARKSLLHLGAC